MIDISKVEVTGFEPAIRGCRNPMNSWDKSDSLFDIDDWDLDGRTIFDEDKQLPSGAHCAWEFWIGPNDLDLMTRLAKAGTEHSKYRRMIIVTCDITAPLYWWKEYDTYKVGTVANSCSTMHKIAAKEFELDDFSNEHLIKFPKKVTKDDLIKKGYRDKFCAIAVNVSEYSTLATPFGVLEEIVGSLNLARRLYLETKDKKYWWQMIQLLPSSYNQKRTVQLSYENLAAIYRQRKDHKLDEWHDFCEWIKTLPYAKEIITMEEKLNES